MGLLIAIALVGQVFTIFYMSKMSKSAIKANTTLYSMVWDNLIPRLDELRKDDVPPTETTLPLNAKWMKELKTQLKTQRFIDRKHRNGSLTIFTLEDNSVELSIDWWLLRRFKGVHRYDLYAFLEDHTGHTVKGIKTTRYRTFISYDQARKYKRQRSEFRSRSGLTLKEWLDEDTDDGYDLDWFNEEDTHTFDKEKVQ